MIGPWVAKRAVAVGFASVLDRLVDEPPNKWHPVAWFGSVMTILERKVWADSRTRGVAYTGAGVAIGLVAGRLIRSTTVALTISIAAKQLGDVAGTIGSRLKDDDLETARAELPALVGRDASGLDASGVSAAVIESLAENTVDAVIAPMFWALAGGAPGALGYRAVNTMDAMVGHHNDRFENFGWASARLDDLANWIPARLFALLVLGTNPNRSRAIIRAVRDDAPGHPSPNAGVAEASVAAALGIELGGTLTYGTRIEHRPLLGRGPRPTTNSIGKARRVTDRTQAAFVALAFAVGAAQSLPWKRLVS